jgi:hypothetical protein
LRKFAGPEEVLTYYCSYMLETREELRVKAIERMEKRMKELDVKARFLLDVVERRLVLEKRGEGELEREMEERRYPLTLLGMKLRSITRRKVEEALEERERVKKELKRYRKLDRKTLWLEQIAQFMEEYEKCYEE